MARQKPLPARVSLDDFTDADLREELRRRGERPPAPAPLNGNYAHALELLRKGRLGEARIELERSLPDLLWATRLEPLPGQTTSPQFVRKVRVLLDLLEELCAPGCPTITHDHDLQRIKVTRAADEIIALMRLR
jgi:hypothetical protein